MKKKVTFTVVDDLVLVTTRAQFGIFIDNVPQDAKRNHPCDTAFRH